MARLDEKVIHLNARIRGMRSRLFTRAAIRELLDRGELKHVIEVLLESPYRTEMAEALTRFHGADAVEEALSRNLTATRHRLMEMAEGRFAELVRLFFMRDDLRAVKSLLRCRHHGLEGEAAHAHLTPGPTMTPRLQEELVESDSMEALVNGLIVWDGELCTCLEDALEPYTETSDLAILEEALDRSYFVENARRLGASKDPNAKTLRAQLQAEIDRINLRGLFQWFESGSEREALEKRLLPQGQLSLSFLGRMAAAGDAAGAMELLGSTPYRALVDELYQFIQTRRFGPVERYFERIIMVQLRRMARADVLGLAVLMEYGWLKYNEMLNLRLVARGLAGHLPTGRVRDELIFAGGS